MLLASSIQVITLSTGIAPARRTISGKSFHDTSKLPSQTARKIAEIISGFKLPCEGIVMAISADGGTRQVFINTKFNDDIKRDLEEQIRNGVGLKTDFKETSSSTLLLFS